MKTKRKVRFKLVPKDVAKIYRELGLEDVTTTRQAQNGNVTYRDPKVSSKNVEILYNFYPKAGWLYRETKYDWNKQRCPLNTTEVTPKLVKKRGKFVKSGSNKVRRVLIKDLSAQMIKAMSNITHFREYWV